MAELLARPWPRGTQVLYVPSHANGNRKHPDCEAGFIWNDTGGDSVYVRYFHKGNIDLLRTKANSEHTAVALLVADHHHTAGEIAGWIGYILAERYYADYLTMPINARFIS